MIRVHHVDHETARKTLQALIPLLPPTDPQRDPFKAAPRTPIEELVNEWLEICREYGAYSIVQYPNEPRRLQRSV